MCCNPKEISPYPGSERNESADNREIVIEAIKNEVGMMTLNLALVLEDQGYLADAAIHHEKIMENQKTMKRCEDRITLFCQGKLASISRDIGLYADAKDLYEGLEKRLRLTSEMDVLTLQSAANLALFLRDQGSYEKALRIIQDNLSSQTPNYFQNISRVKLVSVLATIFMDLRNLELSLYLSRNSLSACEMLLGTRDPFTLGQASNLALVLSELGQYRFAEMIDRQVLDTLEKNLGSNHPQCLTINNRLANNLRFQKQYKRAVPLFIRTLKVQETQLGPSHPETLSTKCGLAATYALQGRFSDSKILLLQAKNQYVDMLSNDHPNRRWVEEALQCLQMVDDVTSQDSALESDNKLRKLHQNFKKLFSAVSLRSLAQMDLDGVDLIQSTMSSLVGTILHKACFHGNERQVKALLMQSNTEINTQAGLFGTPLCAASFQGSTSIVKRLLDAGANPDTGVTLDASALRVALMMNHLDIVRSLLEKRANPNVVDRWYGTPLHEASMAGQSDTVDLLLKFDAKPNLRGGLFGFPLLASAWRGNVNIVKSLLQKGAFVDAHEEGKTALYLAQVERHDSVTTALYMAAAARATAWVAQSDPGPALERIDVVLEAENPVDDHKVAAVSTPNFGHDDDIGGPSISKEVQNTQHMEADSTRTNDSVKSTRDSELETTSVSDYSQVTYGTQFTPAISSRSLPRQFLARESENFFKGKVTTFVKGKDETPVCAVKSTVGYRRADALRNIELLKKTSMNTPSFFFPKTPLA